MQNEVKFAGFGGQGILMSGKLLALAAMAEGLEVAWTPSYGPEMRGGTAYCTVVISDRPIGSPIIKNPRHLVAMNLPSMEKFAPTVRAGGVILVNSSLIPIHSGREDVDELRVPVTEAARDLGNVRVANIIAVGAFVARCSIVSYEVLKAVVEKEFSKKPEFLEINQKALEIGRGYAQKS